MKLRLGTRGSELALTQSGHVAEALRRAWPGLEVDLVVIKTAGDRQQEKALAAFGGKGVFTKELEDALLDGRVDFAVHSLKDLPSLLPAGLTLAATPKREDPRDCLISRVPLDELPAGARVGTGSPRRRAQLLARRPDLQCLEIRGNLPTRARKWREGQYDATVLAHAGLNRLGLEATGLEPKDVHPLEVEVCLPAAGQGLLGLELREGDARTAEFLAALAHPESAWAAAAERGFLAELGGGCQAPAAAHAQVEDGTLTVDAFLARADGTDVLRTRLQGGVEEADSLGRQAARVLLEAGGRALLESAPPAPIDHP